MNTETIKQEVDKNLEKLAGLRDEVRVRLHLASLDAKQEWDDKLAPHVLEVEQAARNVTETSKKAVSDLIDRVELFLEGLKPQS